MMAVQIHVLSRAVVTKKSSGCRNMMGLPGVRGTGCGHLSSQPRTRENFEIIGSENEGEMRLDPL